MFTGLIEEKGKIASKSVGAKSCRLKIEASVIFDDLTLGDSVAVNGVCLTVSMIDFPFFYADVMAETVRKSNIGNLNTGDFVNLERAMKLGGRFGGHIVSGHIDGTGTITSITREDNAHIITIATDSNILRYIVYKGSVALDGISLTVANVSNDSFTVSIIPHTGEETTLLNKKTGYKINIECDVIGKYVERFTSKKSSGITLEFLKENGF